MECSNFSHSLQKHRWTQWRTETTHCVETKASNKYERPVTLHGNQKKRSSCCYSNMNLTCWFLLDNVGTVIIALYCYKQHVVSLKLHSCQEQYLHTKNVAWNTPLKNGNNCTTKDGRIMVLKLQAKILTLSLQTLQCFTPKEENKSKSTEIINKLCKQSFCQLMQVF